MFNSIFHELIKGNTLQEITDFNGFFNVKYLKEIKRFRSLQVKVVSYLETKRASVMELFCEYT